MAFEVEDEVDYSDGSLDHHSPNSPVPRRQSSYHQPEEETYQQTGLFGTEEYEQLDLPFGEPLSQDPARTSLPSKPRISRARRARIGVHFNRREPTKDDYSNFVLYQANQKTYEAVFLKTFIAHALHPNRLRTWIHSDLDNGGEHIERYLQSVSKNVNQIVTKMIWNAHSRTVNLLANDDKQSAHFWDIQRFDGDLFSDFSPDNAVNVVDKMNESWHRAFRSPPMVRYTTKDYPVGKHCSPFEEIDEVAETLFLDSNLGRKLATGRVLKPPSTRKHQSRDLPGAAPRSTRGDAPPRNWLRSLAGPSTEQGGLGSVPDAEDKATYSGEHFSNISNFPSKYDAQVRQVNDENMNLDDGSADQNIIPDFEHHASCSTHDTSSPAWRTKLMNEYKRRLGERWPRSQQRMHETLQDLRTVIDRAVGEGILKPPAPDIRDKIDLAIRIEERKKEAALKQRQKAGTAQRMQEPTREMEKTVATRDNQKKGRIQRKETCNAPRKKRKTDLKPKDPQAASNSEHHISSHNGLGHIDNRVPLSPPPSQSSSSQTLENHQVLPPNAYFEQTKHGEQPAWRCGIKHAMGYYYNAGDRKNCPGCFTSVNENPKLKWMDFYMPSRAHFFQPAPGIVWKPSKQYVKQRRSKHLSHNSIAKEAFWAAMNAGASADEARQKGIEAVEEHLRSKLPPEPVPQPTPEPSPEPIDLGPHPSGSKTMEHGQDLPECAYWEKEDPEDELAWRCDVNHALGRYYLAGNKKCCPGCGSNKQGIAKQAEMDFHLPSGVVVRQDAPTLVSWKPRKPYKTKHPKNKKPQAVTHNQICSRLYWDAVDAGQAHEEALAIAIRETDDHLDAKNEEVINKQSEHPKTAKAKNFRDEDSHAPTSDIADRQGDDSDGDDLQYNPDGGLVFSLVPRKRGSEELSDDEPEDSGQRSRRPHSVICISSGDESSSSSDSE